MLVPLGGATTLKDKQAVAALLTRFKKLPIMVPTRSVPGNSDTLDVSTTAEVKRIDSKKQQGQQK